MAKRKKRARNHGWLDYFSDLQFDTVMWVYNEGSVRSGTIHERTLRYLIKEGFVVEYGGFIRSTPTLHRLVKASANAEELRR